MYVVYVCMCVCVLSLVESQLVVFFSDFILHNLLLVVLLLLEV